MWKLEIYTDINIWFNNNHHRLAPQPHPTHPDFEASAL